MLVVIALVVVAVVATATWVAISSSDSSSSSDPNPAKVASRGIAEVGEQAPDFEATTLDGKTVRLSDYAGRPVVVNFWAAYCAPCREEFPVFRKALKAAGKDFVLLGVNSQDDIRSDARRFVKQEHAKWPIVVDSDGGIADAYGVRGLPQTFFIDRDGKIAQRYYAEVPADDFDQEVARIS